MKRYKTLNIIFNIAAICLFVAGIVTFSSESNTSVGIVFICCGFIFLNSANIFLRKQQEKPEAPAEKSPEEPTIEELPEEELPTPTTVHAEVIDMVCGTGMMPMIGHKTPKAVRYFLIKFKTDDGQELEFEVEEEAYQGFDIGLTGTLTFIGEELYGFEPDEEQQ